MQTYSALCTFLFYFFILFLTGDVKCFKNDCYPLAFGVPALLMIMAIVLFWCGRHKYKRVPQTGNIVWQVVKAVSYALKKKITVKVRIKLELEMSHREHLQKRFRCIGCNFNYTQCQLINVYDNLFQPHFVMLFGATVAASSFW